MMHDCKPFKRRIVYTLLALIFVLLISSLIPLSKGKRNTFADYKVGMVLQSNNCTTWSVSEIEKLYNIYREYNGRKEPVTTDVELWLLDNASSPCGNILIRYKP